MSGGPEKNFDIGNLFSEGLKGLSKVVDFQWWRDLLKEDIVNGAKDAMTYVIEWGTKEAIGMLDQVLPNGLASRFQNYAGRKIRPFLDKIGFWDKIGGGIAAVAAGVDADPEQEETTSEQQAATEAPERVSAVPGQINPDNVRLIGASNSARLISGVNAFGAGELPGFNGELAKGARTSEYFEKLILGNKDAFAKAVKPSDVFVIAINDNDWLMKPDGLPKNLTEAAVKKSDGYKRLKAIYQFTVEAVKKAGGDPKQVFAGTPVNFIPGHPKYGNNHERKLKIHQLFTKAMLSDPDFDNAQIVRYDKAKPGNPAEPKPGQKVDKSVKGTGMHPDLLGLRDALREKGLVSKAEYKKLAAGGSRPRRAASGSPEKLDAETTKLLAALQGGDRNYLIERLYFGQPRTPDSKDYAAEALARLKDNPSPERFETPKPEKTLVVGDSNGCNLGAWAEFMTYDPELKYHKSVEKKHRKHKKEGYQDWAVSGSSSRQHCEMVADYFPALKRYKDTGKIERAVLVSGVNNGPGKDMKTRNSFLSNLAWVEHTAEMLAEALGGRDKVVIAGWPVAGKRIQKRPHAAMLTYQFNAYFLNYMRSKGFKVLDQVAADEGKPKGKRVLHPRRKGFLNEAHRLGLTDKHFDNVQNTDEHYDDYRKDKDWAANYNKMMAEYFDHKGRFSKRLPQKKSWSPRLNSLL